MKTIRRDIPARVKVSYQCGVCSGEYPRRSQAKKCEARILEIQKFAIGEVVKNLEPRVCPINDDSPYFFEGIIKKILGPRKSDYEYEVKWLGAQPERLNGHIYQYEVEYVCPKCNNLKSHLYYSPELKSLRVIKKTGPYRGPEKKY